MESKGRNSGVIAVKKSTCLDHRRALSRSRPLFPAIAAIGGVCGLAATPAGALELGDVQVQSTLGQPLRASIAYALGPNEQLYDFCIYLRPGQVGDGIPAVTRARVSLTEGTIVLTGNAAVKDPLLNVRLAVDCPYTPHLQREYTLMLNPRNLETAPPQPVFVESRQAAPIAQREPAVAEAAAGRSDLAPAPRPALDDSPIAVGDTYRVQVGDTASTIASRIPNRSVALWPAVFAIVDANPDAFVDGDLNRLVAGSVLTIPDFSAGSTVGEAIEPVTVETAEALPDPVAEPGPEPAADDIATRIEAPADPIAEPVVDPVETFAEVTSEPVESGVEDSSPFVGGDVAAEETVGLGLTITANEELRPGDVVVAPAGTAAPPANTGILPIEDADIPQVTASDASSAGSTWSWLIWLAGAGLAVVLALLLFGNKLSDRFRPSGASVARKPVEEDDEDPTLEARAIEDLDFNFDDPIAARAMSLDADFDDGTGLDDNADIDVMQDFSFAAEAQSTNEVDIEITEDQAREPESQPTDVIPPSHRIDESSILETEVPPGELTGDYDMSMIIDATRQPIGDYDRTAQDLQAVRVDDEEYVVEDQTLSDEVGLKVLEQDYEDELTATQALNLEIEKAARELADRMDDGDIAGTLEQPTVEMSPDDATAEMTVADATAEVTLSDDLTASDETGINETVEMPPVSDPDLTAELTANLPTDIEADNDPTASDTGSRETVEMKAAGSDISVDMQVESGKVDTKKRKGGKKHRK